MDGSLIYWFLEGLPAPAREQILTPILQAWQTLQPQRVALFDYISASRSGEALNFLRLLSCPYPVPDCSRYCAGKTERAPCQVFSPLKDVAFWQGRMQPGERAPSGAAVPPFSRSIVLFCYNNFSVEHFTEHEEKSILKMMRAFFKFNKEKQFYILFLILFVLFSFGILILSLLQGESPDLIISDGNGYYAWLRSLIIDGDLNFENDFQELYFPDPPPPEINLRTPKGLIPNKYPVGMSILEIPGFLIGHCIAQVSSFSADGLSLPYQVCISFSLVAFVAYSFYFFYCFLENWQVNSRKNLFISITFLLGTNIIHYIAKEPCMSHSAGVALINMLLYVTSIINQKSKSIIPYFGCGLLLGLLFLVRNTNILFYPLISYLFLQNKPRKNQIGSMIFGTLLMVFIQQLSLFYLWGSPIIYSYQGEGFDREILDFWRSLFGQGDGVFLYHFWYFILLTLNFLGLFFVIRYRIIFALSFISFISLWFVNSLWGDFGDTFGHRGFIETLSSLSFVSALAFDNISFVKSWIDGKKFVVISIGLTCLNFYIWAGYLLNQYPHSSARNTLDVYLWIFK